MTSQINVFETNYICIISELGVLRDQCKAVPIELL